MSGTGQQAQNEYGQYHVPAGVEHRPAAKAVLAGQVYEPETIAFMRQHAGDGDIIHAGAFFGDFLPALSTALDEQAKLWAFEPNPVSFEAANKTVALNNLSNVTLTNAALSDRVDDLRLRTHRKGGLPLGGASHLVEEDGKGVTSVKSVMLDYAVPIARKVSVLQLDVEGHEKQALKGAFHIINAWKPILILEFFSDQRWLSRTFRGLGYHQIGKLHRNYVYAAGQATQ